MSGLDAMRKRMLWEGAGSPHSDGRNVHGKFLSFKSALWNSYQAEWITFKGKKWRCLINPDKQTVDYDQKEISICYESGMKGGDTFYWDRTGHYWMAYMQKYEEEAYFRATLRRCDYEIAGYPVYVRGPVETALIWRQKHQIEMNDMNYSIMFYIEKNDETMELMSRFSIFKFEGHNWRVAATDKYSQPGIIEVYAEEYFDNEMEDNMVIPEVIEPDKKNPYIDGPQFVKPFDTNLSFTIVGKANGTFVVNSSKVKIVKTEDNTCFIDVLTGKSGDFDLSYQVEGEDDVVLHVTIKSL